MLQVLQHYLTVIDADVISEINLAPDSNGWLPCDPEDFVYGPATTYWCSDIFMHEEKGVSTIHNEEARLAVHHAARKRVQDLWAQRGSIH